MSDLNKNNNTGESKDITYDSFYYKNYNGNSYGRTADWLSFFDKISENIVERLQPKTVLDVGCAYGLLVETLRNRGVDAFGIDISEYAIQQVRDDLRDYCSVSSILEPLANTYDLIVSIEVIEHIDEKDCDQVIKNLCLAADQILLATTPDDFDDPTHFNVQIPLYWIQKFSQYGFEPDITFDASFLTPYAILFKKNYRATHSQMHSLFGAKKLLDLDFSRVTHERNMQSVELREHIEALNYNESLVRSLEDKLEESQVHIKNLQEGLLMETTSRIHYRNELQQHQEALMRIKASWFWKVAFPIRILNRTIRILNRIRMILSPFIPRPISKSACNPSIECEASNFRGWGLIKVDLKRDENVTLKLKARAGDKTNRVTVLPIKDKGKMRSWIFQNKREVSGYTAEITHIDPISFEFVTISTLSALINLMLYRLRMGRSAKAAMQIVARCFRHFLRGNPQIIFQEIWPNSDDGEQAYEEWLDCFDIPFNNDHVTTWLNQLEYQPLISIILPTYNSNLDHLSDAVNSVKNQSYPNWQLCIADDNSNDKKLKKWLHSLVSDERINVRYRESNGHISEASNTAIDMAKGEFIAFLDHDDELHVHALAAVVGELNKCPEIDLIYTDEDKIDSAGHRCEPNFKPDWNPDLLLSQNYICHLTVYRRALVKQIGGLRAGYEGAQDYDLLLRFTELTQRIRHIPLILYHWRAVEGSTALDAGQKDYAHQRAVNALQDSMTRRNIAAQIDQSGIGVYHRVKYTIPTPEPLVSIIIPTRDRVDLVKLCIDGIIERTHYKNWEVLLIDNDSQRRETFDYFNDIQSDIIRVLKFGGKFNYSAINNFGASQAKGDVLLLLNNDIEVIEPEWLTELVSHAIRPEIGAVGARLYYANDTVQHDGIIVGMGGVAGYANPGLQRTEIGDFGGSRLIRNYSAVTAAVLAVKKRVFMAVDGLDEKNLSVAFNDVDFCLRISELGLRNLYTPYCELYHHESLSRGADIGSEKAARFEKEVRYMKKKWPAEIAHDPYYNPNLSLKHGFSLDINRGQCWPWESCA